MTGANYMGGKRNAAKARTRDSTGRIQRGFFGRQRLNMLSKGITRRTPASPSNQKPSIPVIELAHASLRHKELGTRERMDGKSSDDRTTTTFVSVPKTPESILTKGSSSSSNTRSRVLDVLDTKEPMFLRAALNRILTLPDLAGLSGTGHASKRLRVEEDNSGYERSDRKRKKTISPSNDEVQLFHSQLTPSSPSVQLTSNLGTGIKGNRHSSNTKNTCDGLYTAPKGIDTAITYPRTSKDDELLDHLQLSKSMSPVPRSNHLEGVGLGMSSLPPSSEQTSSSDIVGTFATGTIMDFEDQDWDDSGLDLESNHQSPLPQGAWEQSLTQSVVALPPEDDHGDGISTFNVSPRRCPRFAENNLYEHQDPWHTIGVILGLSPVRPDDRILDGASEEQDIPFSRIIQSLSETEDENSSLNGYVPRDGQNSDKSAMQQGFPYFSVAEDELDVDLDEDPTSDAQESRCASQQNSPSLFTIQEEQEKQAHDTRTATTDIDFKVLLHANSLPGPVRTPSPVSSVNNYSLGSSQVSGSLAPLRSSSSRSQSSLALRTPSPRGAAETQSPFRMLLAARNQDQKKNSNLASYSHGDLGPSSSPGTKTSEFESSMLPNEIDGVFQGPCLFPEDAYDASNEN